ncbi:MAG TPA: DNA primase [Acidimicrobiales bacterium]
MGIVDEDIDRVREAVPLVDVVQQYVALRRVGRRWVGLCPFHAEKTGSFNVNDERGFYKCFGCGASGDVISFVREVEHLDFVGAVEWLATKAGVQLRYTTGGEGRDRLRRKQLVEAMSRAVDWYHERLLSAPDGRAARDYLRSRGISGDTARHFKLGWAPDEWDALAQGLGLPAEVLRDTGLAFLNKRNRLQDAFRARLMFPIFTEAGDPVAFGGRILPGSADPAKYKNSPETSIYTKSKVLYGLNWAKAAVVQTDEVIVCEGYTDVIGFHRAGVTRAVATCGTALTEEHFRLLTRFAKRVVLAFDADEAGQGAAERFYEWERKYDVSVGVARLPQGTDPGELASSDPAALKEAVDQAEPFLRFRLQRVYRQIPLTSPETRAKAAEAAMAVVNEHPDANVRAIYAGEIAAHTGVPERELLEVAKRRTRDPRVAAPVERRLPVEYGAEAVVLWLMMNRWDEVAPWLVEGLFVDDVCLAAFRALAEAGGDWQKSLEVAEPAARELLERLAVDELEVDGDMEVRNLIAAATRREIARVTAQRDLSLSAEVQQAKLALEGLGEPSSGAAAAEQLLTWLDRRNEERP